MRYAAIPPGTTVASRRLKHGLLKEWGISIDRRLQEQVLAALVPTGRVKATVRHGWVTLTGTTSWPFQRAAAERAALAIPASAASTTG